MWPLLAFSILTVSICVERSICLFYHNLKMDDLKKITEDAILGNKINDAIGFLENRSARRIGAGIILGILKSSDKSVHFLERRAEAEAQKCISFLEKGLNYLTVLGSISPLTGFLGTVTGMIAAFRAIAEAEEVSAQIVANGIYEALITTVFGLIIAITAMAAHSILSNKVDKFTSETEETCSDIILKLIEKERSIINEAVPEK